MDVASYRCPMAFIYIRPTDCKLAFHFSTVARRRQNTILVKVPGPEESQEEQESGSEASDSVSNGGHSSNPQNGQNVTLITLNSEGMTSHWHRGWSHMVLTHGFGDLITSRQL